MIEPDYNFAPALPPEPRLLHWHRQQHLARAREIDELCAMNDLSHLATAFVMSDATVAQIAHILYELTRSHAE